MPPAPTLPARRRGHPIFFATLMTGTALLCGAAIGYMVWPRAAEAALDAPSLPINVGGVTFNVPPASVRVAMQRRPGTQMRLDLAFQWPSLAPPDPKIKNAPADPRRLFDRLFVTVAVGDGALPTRDRLATIYPRYATVPTAGGADGLVRTTFRSNSPYRGEELIFDPAAPERFLLRCTLPVNKAPGMCLHERRLGGADVTVRFPSDWLNDWRGVAAGIDRAIAGLRPTGV